MLVQTKDSVSAQKSRKIAGLNDRESWAIKRCFHMGDETEMKLASLAMHIGAKWFWNMFWSHFFIFHNLKICLTLYMTRMLFWVFKVAPIGSLYLFWHDSGATLLQRQRLAWGKSLLSPCPLWIALCQLNFYQKFPNFFVVKIDINLVNLTPCQAHWIL